MIDDDEDDLYDASVPVRPYSGDDGGSAASKSFRREQRAFRPKPPNERRSVERSLLSWVPMEETAQTVLQNALRRQQADSDQGINVPFVPQRFQGMALNKFGIESTKLGSGGGMAFGVTGVSAPKTSKQYKEGKSLDLADLAFTPRRQMPDGTVRVNYTPISLPYFNVMEDETSTVNERSSSSTKKGRPMLHHVDESNSNAAKELFLDADGDLKEDNFLLIQLPSALPELADPAEEIRTDDDAAGLPGGISRLPDGLLGKLKIHKSGKVRMEIGGVPYCVDQGCATFFHQELACVCPLAKEMINLGAIQSRVVCTPDIQGMFAELAKAEAAKAEAAAATPADGEAAKVDVAKVGVAKARTPPLSARATAPGGAGVAAPAPAAAAGAAGGEPVPAAASTFAGAAAPPPAAAA